jgi:signal-transduction protein with cAMP-binding, CBS, and nucleotidyltransferase domain
MRARRVSCLPVVEDGALVGIVTAQDFLIASTQLFKERLTPKAAAQEIVPEMAQSAHQAG